MAVAITAGLISYCTPYFLNADDLNWGAKYGYIWAGSNAIAFGKPDHYLLFFSKLKASC